MFNQFFQAPSKHHQKQKGAVLIVCLVLLTVLTIIGINTSTDIGLQSNMARNSQLKQTAFNLALSELEAQRDLIRQEWDNTGQSAKLLVAQAQPTEPVRPAETTLEMHGKSDFEVGYNYVFTGDTCLRIGESDGAGGKLYGDLYLMNSTASLDNTGTQSSQTMGLCSK